MSNICYGVDMSKEIWRTKPEWKGYYEFSNWGRARSVDRIVTYSNGRKQLYKGQLRKINSDGSIILQIQGKKYNEDMRNIIPELFIDEYKKGMPISFRDGNTSNFSLDNIILGIWDDIGKTKLLEYDLNKTNQLIFNTPIIEGGFGTSERILFDITLAEKVNKSLFSLRADNILAI